MAPGPLARLAPMAFGGISIPQWQAFARAEWQRRQSVLAFTVGGGFRLSGDPGHQQAFMKALKQAMWRSPSFSKLMFEIQADSRHPVEVQLGRNLRGVFVDGFDSSFELGKQEVDLADLDHFPIDPPTGFPHATTQGELLAHAMAEAREGAQGLSGGRDEYQSAHNVGIDAQNLYRDDIGQRGHRLHKPDDTSGRTRAGTFNLSYDNLYSEVWVTTGTTPGERSRSSTIESITRFNPPPSKFGAEDLKKDMEGLQEQLKQQRP